MHRSKLIICASLYDKFFRRSPAHRLRTFVTAMASFLSLLGPAESEENCQIAYRELGGARGGASLREHVCTIAKDSSLKITFVRFNEVITGNLVMGEQIPEVQQLLGEISFAKNEVFAALEPLYKQFAYKQVFLATTVRLAIDVFRKDESGAWVGRSINIGANANASPKYRRLWSITAPFSESVEGYPIYMQALRQVALETSRFPADVKFFYRCDDEMESAKLCTTLWKYIPRSELNEIARNTAEKLKERERTIRRKCPNMFEADSPSSAESEYSSWPKHSLQFDSHFALFKHLGKANWPQSFLITAARTDYCTAGFEFEYFPRPLALDVAIIENVSNVQSRVCLLGSADLDADLAPMEEGTDQPEFDDIGELVLPPKAKRIVPLRIVLLDSSGPVIALRGDTRPIGEARLSDPEQRASSALKSANKNFAKIKVTPHKSDFFRNGRGVIKSRDAYLPPEVPAVVNYTFGPTIELFGLEAGGRRFRLGNNAEQSVALAEPDRNEEGYSSPDNGLNKEVGGDRHGIGVYTNPEAQASCPYLYMWDGGEGAWIKHGKVIHSASDPTKEEASVVPVDPQMRRFRLAEEEPEVAFIRKVELLLTLRDGRRVVVAPKEHRTRAGGFQFIIPAYTAMDFDFDVKDEFVTLGIAKSEIAIKGYYRRLSDLDEVAQLGGNPLEK